MLRNCKIPKNIWKGSYLSYARYVHLKQSSGTCHFSKLKLKTETLFERTCQTLSSTHCSKRHQQSPISERQLQQAAETLNREVKALSSLLNKSGIRPQNILRQFLNNDGSRIRWFSTSSSSKQQQNQEQNPDQERKQDNEDKDPERKQDDEDDDKDLKNTFMLWMQLLTYSMITFWILRGMVGDSQDADNPNKQNVQISWNEFVHDMLSKGEVDEIIVRPELEMAFIRLHQGAVVKGRKGENMSYYIKLPDMDKFESKVRKVEEDFGIKPGSGVPITYYRGNALASFLVFLIILAVLARFLRSAVNFQVPDMFSSLRKAKFVRVDQISNQPGRAVTFRDVAGLHEAKVEVMEFVDYLKNPDRYKRLGARIPHGVLLLGPPGCGKTLLAKAVATEAKVPFLAMAGSEFVEIVGGLGAARVRDLFKEAREKKPCIIYIDEVDAIGRKRGGESAGEGTSEGEHTLNQLLVELDGMDTMEGIIMLASTNRHEVLDNALLRPGRFDRHIKIDLPTLAERKEVFEIYLGNLKTVRGVQAYSERLAQLSPGMSGADIRNICNEAALAAARDKKKAVDAEDFEYAVERVIAGVAKKSRVLSPQEKKVVAYHEAGHAVVSWLLKYTDSLLKVTIVPRTGAALGFAQYTPSDKYLISKEEMFEMMCVALGGRVAESVTFNSVTSGAQNDLQKVKEYAYQQIRKLGMNDVVGHVSYDVNEENEFAVKPYSKKMAAIIDEEAQKLIVNAYRTTEKILLDNKEKLRVVAEALLEKETLSYADMEELIGPPPHGKPNTLSAKWGPKPEEPPTPPASPPKPPGNSPTPPVDVGTS